MGPVDLKIVLLGKEHCGKTSIVERFIYNRFSEDLPYQNTIGAAFGAKKMEVNGETLTIGLWDTAGSERYEAMCRIYYRNAGAAIVCYDLTDSGSFEKAKFWVEELKKHEEACKIYLCGTKLDLVKPDKKMRKVDYHTTTDYADEVRAVGVYETSSKTNEGISELFLAIAKNFISSKSQNAHGGLESFSIANPPSKGSKCC